MFWWILNEWRQESSLGQRTEGRESSLEHSDRKYVVRKICSRDTLRLITDHLKEWLPESEFMKLRALFLAAVAFVVLAVAVIPASAKTHHRHHRHHRHSR